MDEGSVPDLSLMHEDQSGRCSDCEKTKDRVIRRLTVTGTPRLCDGCHAARQEVKK